MPELVLGTPQLAPQPVDQSYVGGHEVRAYLQRAQLRFSFQVMSEVMDMEEVD